MLLRELDLKLGLMDRLVGCFTDLRDQRYVDHFLPELLRQRIGALALGYEDLNDHDGLRHDPAHALMAGKSDIEGLDRSCERNKGKALAGHSTLNRMELGCLGTDGRYKKILPDPDKLEALLIEEGVKAIPRKSRRIVLDFDATDDPLHGSQELPCRSYRDFQYTTLKSWSRKRRVVGKAEILPKGNNPRFIVTNLTAREWEASSLYEDFYCARGDMENRIKEQQLDLFADRTSTQWMASNQLRLWFSAFAHLMLSQLRAEVLKDTALAQATLGTIRLKLFKIAARIWVSCRRIHLELSSACPCRDTFARAWANLQAWPT